MASTVLSGPSNPSYTNNTGQNVRVVINFMRSLRIANGNAEILSINWAGVGQTYSNRGDSSGTALTDSPVPVYIGRNLAFVQSIIAPDDAEGGISPTVAALSSNNAMAPSTRISTIFSRIPSESEVALALPTEIILAPGQTFSAQCGVHNIVVIPELS